MPGFDALGGFALGGSPGGPFTLALGLATETDSAFELTPTDLIVIVGIAEETDTAFVVSHLLLGLTLETDTALSCTPVRTKAVGLATETDSALAVTLSSGQTIVLGLATETDSALSILLRRLVLPVETDTALPVQALQTSYWPFDDLKPRHIGIHPVASPIGGGVALTGREPTINSGAGYWHIAYGGVYVKTRAQVYLLRAMESRFEGRGRSILVYIYDGKRAPWLTVGDAITAAANAAVAQGATAINILATSAGELLVGQFFSVGHSLYLIKTISGPVANVYTCTIWPETREAIASGASLEFKRPKIRVRLRDDAGLAMQLRLLRFGDVNVEFVEDVP